jgi:ParB family chromosome partitioning protein
MLMTRKTGLGRGLEALIPGLDSTSPSAPSEIPIDLIVPNPRQPRIAIDSEELAGLVESIREHGVIQPIILTRDEASDRYILVAGERRWVAARQAGLISIPAIVRTVEDDRERLELALIENIQRSDLNPLEAAEAYRQLHKDFGLSHEEISARVGKSRVTITNTLRLLNLPQDVQQAIREALISEGHARALLGLHSDQAQSAVLQTILSKDLTVRQTEELVRRLSGSKPAPKARVVLPPEIQSIEDRLRERLGTKVHLNPQRKGGKVVIYYYSKEEFDSLIDILLGETGYGSGRL